MAFCSNCGHELQEGAAFCMSCGAKVNAEPAAAAGGASFNADQFSAKVNAAMETKDRTAAFDPADISKNKGIALLSYIGILVLVPLFGAKNSKFARFHANQGLVLMLAGIALSLVSAIINTIVGALVNLSGFFSVFSVLFGILFFAIGVLLLVFEIMGIVNAAQGKAKDLPLVSKLKLIK